MYDIEEIRKKLHSMRLECDELEDRMACILEGKIVNCLQIHTMTRRKSWLRALISDLERSYLDDVVA